MLKLKEDGYDGVARVGLGSFGEYFFLQSADAVKSVTLDQADAFPRRFSVPLFETLELDRGIFPCAVIFTLQLPAVFRDPLAELLA